MLQQITTVTHLNSLLSCGDIFLSLIRRSTADEQRTNSFFTNPRFYSKASIQNLRQSLLWQLSSQIFLMLRPIPYNGLCSANISRKPKRYRDLLKSFGRETISLWFSRKSLSEQFSQRQRKKRLANISRLCSSSNQKSKATLCGRRLRRYIEKYCLCFGHNRDRSMPVSVSMGSASKTQKRPKATYTDGPKRLYTCVYTHYKRCCARNYSLSNYASGAVGHIRHGQRLHRFCNIILFFKEQLFLCYSSKKEYSLLSQVFSFDRQKHWPAKRPDNKTDWPKNFETLPHTTEANHFSRRTTATHFCVSNQQFSVGCINHLPDLQTALADRIILQVDQTALANKVILWHFDQCCQDPDMDWNQCLCACGDNQKGTETGAFFTRNTPNSKHPAFRENLAKTSTYGKLLYF